MNKKCFLIAILLIVFSITTGLSQEKYLLKNNLPDGKYKMEQNLLISLVISAKDSSSISQTKSKFCWDLSVDTSSDKTERKIHMKPTRIIYQFAPNGSMGDRIIYDS